MDLYQGNNQPFVLRYNQEIKAGLIILILLLFLGLYKFLPPIQKLVDKPFDFAVAGMSVGYSKITTYLYQKTGQDLGLVNHAPDPEFVFQVRLASYINESRPGPLLDIAVDARLPIEQRERALLALLKFESTTQWIQPFLNELAKGGLPGLYEKDPVAMNKLMDRIRSEGGIRQTLVRDYADSVLSFMFQHPKTILRQHALLWVNDLVTEDALFLIAERIDKEKDPETQQTLEEALWNIRAVSDRAAAINLIQPFYASPPWRGVRAPLSYVLTRIGYEKAREQLRLVAERQNFYPELQSNINVALSGKLFPRSLQISDQLQVEMASRKKARQAQVRWAMRRQMMIQREEENKIATAEAMERKKQRTTELAEAKAKNQEEAEEKSRMASVKRERLLAEKKMKIAEEKERLAQETLRKETAVRAARAKEKEQARLAALKKAEEENKAAEVRLADARRKQSEQKQLARLEKEKKAKEKALKVAAAVPKEPEELLNFDPDAVALPAKPKFELDEVVPEMEDHTKEDLKKETLKQETAFPDVESEESVKEPIDHERTAKKPVDLITAKVSASKPTTSPVSNMESFDEMEKKITVASLPTQDEIDAELARREDAKRKASPKAATGQMMSVNLIFEIKNQDVPLYANPGFTKLTGVILPIGSKGQASFKVVVGDDEWFQVKSKKDTGWANGSLITVYDVPTVGEPIKVAASIPTPESKPTKSAPRATKQTVPAQQEATYFEPNFQGVIVYRDPSDQADQIGTLEEGVPYLATQSQKIGRDRWFLLQLSSSRTGWVHGIELQLAGDILPPPEEMLEPPPAPGEKWVAAADVGVPVYSRPSIVSKKMRTIVPGDSYKVVLEDEESANEWYKISLDGRKEGWVQSMFVKITKTGAKPAKKSASSK